MSFALGQNETPTPGLFTSSGQLRTDLSPNRMRELLRQRFSQPGARAFGVPIPSAFGGVGGLASLGLLGQQPQSGPNLPALPQIPPLAKAPSRLSTRQIAGAARSLRVAASRRKGRASTILGGSIGADPERKTLLGA